VIGTLRQAISLAWFEADGFVKRRLALTLLLVFGTAALAALAPIALKYAVDGLRSGQQTGLEIGKLVGGSTPKQTLIALSPSALILFYIFSLWISRSLGEARWFFFGTADQRLHRRLSRRLLSHIIDLPLSFHLDRKTGALNQTLVQGLAGYRILMNHAVFTVLPVLVEVLIVGAVLVFLFDAEFLAILGLAVIAYVAAFALGATRIIGPIREVSTTQVEAYANLTDSLLNTETIKCFNAESQINERYDNVLAKSERWWSIFYWRKSENGLLVAIVFALSLGAAMMLGAMRVQQGVISVGDFVLINAYMLQIVRPLETLGTAFRDIAYGAAFIEKMMGLMDQKTEGSTIIAIEARAQNHACIGQLEVRQLSFSYVAGRQILDNIDFTIKPGETVAVVGQSGAGKSSLIRLLMRFYEPDSGDILLNGKPIRELTLEELRRSIAIVPQDTILFNDTIAYNIGFGRQGASPEEAERAARFAHIHDRIIAMPDGYRTTVGERGLKLSGGEKQRVSIARAVLKQPQMFIFDEATSSLDTKTEQAILDNLIDISTGMTTLIISHRLSMVVHADEILVLEQGRITERGRHDALLKKNEIYAAMWRTQHRQETDDSVGRKEPA
jgi:ABC-type transport system involved in Fe-S cluster assembly fused permease/ATPase subunit